VNARGSIRLVMVLGIAAAVTSFVVYREVLLHGFSAREKPWAIEAFAARHLRRLAIGTDAARLKNPYTATSEVMDEGREHFADHCSVCHGDDGSGKTETGEGLYPPAPDLRDPGTQELTDGELFSIIQNGIRFTGMPGWGTDEDHWKVVLFIRHLPSLTSEELRDMKRHHHYEDESPHHHHHHHGAVAAAFATRAIGERDDAIGALNPAALLRDRARAVSDGRHRSSTSRAGLSCRGAPRGDRGERGRGPPRSVGVGRTRLPRVRGEPAAPCGDGGGRSARGARPRGVPVPGTALSTGKLRRETSGPPMRSLDISILCPHRLA